MTCNIQTDSFISVQRSYATLKFIYDLGSRLPFSNVDGHDEGDARADERELDDEGVEVGRRLSDGPA